MCVGEAGDEAAFLAYDESAGASSRCQNAGRFHYNIGRTEYSDLSGGEI